MNIYGYEDAFNDGMMAAYEDLGLDSSDLDLYDDVDDVYEGYDDGLYDLDSFDPYSNQYAGEGYYDYDNVDDDYDYELDDYAEESLKDYFNWRKERKIDKKNTKYYLNKYTSIARSLTKELKAKCKEALQEAQTKAEKIAIKRKFDNKIARVWEKCEALKANIPNKIKEHDSAIKKTKY